MIPWMREKFNEKRAKWLARSKRASGSPSPQSSPNSLARHQSSNNSHVSSDADSFSLASGPSSQLPVRTTEMETQTEVIVGGGFVFRTPSPARRRRQRLEQQTTSTQTPPETSTPTLHSTQQANAKNHARLNPNTSTELEVTNYIDFVTVRVICPSSRVLIFKSDVNKRLADLKSEVLLELSDDPESLQLFAPDVRHLNPRYRLIRADYVGTELNENDTLAQLQARNNESFMLVQRRSTLSVNVAQVREAPGPTEAVIEAQTRCVPGAVSVLPTIDINEIFQQSNIQYDVRKVLISLAQASASVIGAGPLATRLISMLKQRLVNKRSQHIDTLQCLVDMGFKPELAEYALNTHNGVYSTSLEWLMQNQNEEEEFTPAGMNLQQSSASISPSAIVSNNDIMENTAALLDIVRIYSHHDAPPSEALIESLTEMGFEEVAVIAALKKTGNNKASACEWLCNNRSGSVIELREGLSPDSPILKAILEMPQVQMTLSNPKTFLAFLAILENEQAIRVWRGDNDTTSVITHILQKYHEEKHVLGINQFYTNRW